MCVLFNLILVLQSLNNTRRFKQLCCLPQHLTVSRMGYVILYSSRLFVLQFVFPSSTFAAVPQQLLSKVNHVISLAEREQITTTKISALLGLLNKAIQYCCSVSQDRLSLHEASAVALKNFDAAFNRFLRKIVEEGGQAKEELKTCELLAGGLTKTQYKLIDS